MTIRFFAAALAAALLCIACVGGVHAHSPAIDAASTQTDRAGDRTDDIEMLAGTVGEIIVNDATRGTSSRHLELVLDDQTRVPLQGDAVLALRNGQRVAVSGQHHGKRFAVDTAELLSPNASVPAPTAADTQIEGTLAVLHADDFASGRSQYVYEVHAASGKARRLRMASLPAPLAPGMHVRVDGHAEADLESVTPAVITILAAPATSSSADGTLAKAATASSVLVIMANFSNTVAPAFTSAQAQQVMTSNTDSVANFFRENSYGQQLMNVTVTPGWVTMALARPATCTTNDWQAIGSAAEAASRTLGAAYEPSAYNFVVYLFPAVSACGWTGLAYISSPHKAWLNGTSAFRTVAIAHEMGHNFGLLHAGSVRCGTAIIGGSCSVAEYGDPFDAMGNQRAMHYSAAQKSKLAWIAPASVLTHSGGAVTYTLTPLEVAGGAAYAVRIPTASANRTYWLEFRQPIGFDSPLSAFPNNGAQIRVASPFETLCFGCDAYSDDTQILDTTPATQAFTDATLVAGQTFTDATYGVQVTVLAASAGALTLQVATGSAAAQASINVALGANGGVASASSSMGPANLPDNVNNGQRSGAGLLTGGGGWADAVAGVFPDWVQIDFAGSRTIDHVVVYSVQDDFLNPVEPTDTMTFTKYGLTAFSVQGWDGSTWITLGSVSGNNLVKRTVSFAPYTTDRIRVVVTAVADNLWSRITEIEAWTPGASVATTNYALAANGGVASASSSMGPANLPDNVNNGQRSGAGLLTGGGGWADAVAGVFPDWVQIDFTGSRTIDHVVVYSVQDDFLNPVEPTDTMTFTKYGLTAFSVQGWDGSTWITLGSVSGNNLVKRTVSFAPYTTNHIRVVVTAVADNLWSRITEIEAWGN